MRIKRAIVFLSVLSWPILAGDWSHWRGPDFDGSSPETGLAEQWNTSENVAWKAPMPGPGATTPIIVGEHVFVSSIDKANGKVLALCLDRTDGSVRWSHEIGPDRKYPRSHMAVCSPTSDGKRVVFMFSDGTLAAFDVGGQLLWQRRVHEQADMAIQFGYTSSPLLFQDRVIIQVLQNPRQVYRHLKFNPQAPRDSFLLALDVATGKEVYKEPRTSADAVDESFESYASPVLRRAGAGLEVLVLGGDCLSAHDPLTGKERWRWGSFNPEKNRIWRQVASPTPGDGAICVPLPRGTATVGIKPEGGTPESRPALWRYDDLNPDVCCAAWYQGRFYVLDGDKRKLTSIDGTTGQKVWTGTLSEEGIFRASPTATDGRIFTISERGEVVITAAGGDAFKVLQRIEMGEPLCQGSIAIAYGQLFIRTGQHVYCIGKH